LDFGFNEYLKNKFLDKIIIALPLMDSGIPNQQSLPDF
jgi:hypothetical protein